MTGWAVLVGREVARLRKERGVSAQALADACQTIGHPVPRNTITNMENGRRSTIDVAELVTIARALDVPPLDLLFPDDTDVEYLPGVVRSTAAAKIEFVGAEPPQPRLLRKAHQHLQAAAEAIDEMRGNHT